MTSEAQNGIGQIAQWSLMFVERILRLVLVAVLTVGLGVGVTLGNTQPIGRTAHAALSAIPDPGDCSPCKDCGKPCAPSVMCGSMCVVLGLTHATQGVASRVSPDRPALMRDSQLSSAELNTPTPPPRLSHFI